MIIPYIHPAFLAMLSHHIHTLVLVVMSLAALPVVT